KADLPRRLDGLGGRRKAASAGPIVAWDNWDTGFRHRDPGRCFFAHHRHRVSRRANEGNASRIAGVGEVFVLAQEPVTGVNSVGASGSARRENLVDIEVAFARWRRANMNGAVG